MRTRCSLVGAPASPGAAPSTRGRSGSLMGILISTPCWRGRNGNGQANPLSEIRVGAVAVPTVGDRREASMFAGARLEEEPGAPTFLLGIRQPQTQPRKGLRDGLRLDPIDLPGHALRIG